MLRAAIAATRLAASVALGRRLAPWSLDWIVAAMLATRAEFGELDGRAVTAATSAGLDESTRRAIQLRRMRALVSRRDKPSTTLASRKLPTGGRGTRSRAWP